MAIVAIVVVLFLYVPYFDMLCYITEIACIIKIIASDDNPDYKVPWLLLVLVFPIVGFMLYFIFYSRTLKRKYVKRLNMLKDAVYHKNDTALFCVMEEENPSAASQAKMLCNISGSHLFIHTKQEYFSLGEEMYQRLLEDLSNAKIFIYMEYFIIEEGVF